MSLINVKQREGISRDLWTGVIEYRVISVNPTHEQLKEMLGTDKINPPNYLNNGKLRLDFWLHNEELNIKTKFSIWLENKDRVAKSGNILYINKKNQATWLPDLQSLNDRPNMAWFDASSARVAKVGEDTLYDFIVAYINADTSEGGIILDDFERLITEGNTEELTKLIEHYNNMGQTVKLLTGVKDGRQALYTNFFIRSNVRSTKALMTKLESNPFNADYVLDGIQKYDPAKFVNVMTESTTGTIGNAPQDEGGLF